MPRMPAVPDEDELDELPPLDGETGDSAEAEEAIDEIAEESGVAALDDATGEDDAVDTGELALGDNEKSWLDEPADAPELDLGDVALIVLRDDGFSLDEPDEAPAVYDDLGGIEAAPRVGLDTGDEGPLDADEELRDEDLPALDADDEGELADAGFVDDRFAADEPLGLPWATVPWSRVGAPLGIFRATAVACAGRSALVSGRLESNEEGARLVRVDLEGARRAVDDEGLNGTEAQAVAAGTADSRLVAVVLRGGRVAVSADGGARFEPRAQAGPVADAAIASGTIWLRTRAGGLFALCESDRALGRCVLSGAVVAVTTNGPTLVALVVDDRRPAAILRGNADGTVTREPIEAPEVRASALLAARGQHLAYPGRSGVVRRGPDGVWHSFAWQGRVTAMTFVDDRGTLLAATYSDADDTTGLVRTDPGGATSVVARIGAPRGAGRSDGRAHGMACDDAHGVVWVAGGFGVAAFAIAPQ